MAFYVGCYQILADSLEPAHNDGPWALPDAPAQHMADTSNVEELFLNVTDMDVLPSQIQFGQDTWTDDEGFSPDHGAFDQFYIRDEAFYVRGFTATNGYTQTFYPAGGFYVRGFSPTDTWTPSFYPRGGFYVRGFAPTDFWTPMFYTGAGFYVRNFTPTDSWTEFYVGC
jgi:hypothetical protein